MVGGQTVAQSHRQIECLVVVHGFEGSFHAHQYTITDGQCLFLSDKLLEVSSGSDSIIPCQSVGAYKRAVCTKRGQEAIVRLKMGRKQIFSQEIDHFLCSESIS